MNNASGTSKRAALQAALALEAKRKQRLRIFIALASVISVTVIVLVTVVLFQHYGRSTSLNQITPPNATKDFGILTYPGKASTNAPKVVIWADPQCPLCKVTTDTYGKVFHSLAQKGEISLEYKIVFFLDQGISGENSYRATVGATIADGFNKFIEYTDAVFNHQPEVEGDGFTDELLRNTIPSEIGLSGDNLAKFQKQYDDRATNDFVIKTQEQFASKQVSGTPYITVNGNKVDLLTVENKQLFKTVGDTEAELLSFLKKHS